MKKPVLIFTCVLLIWSNDCWSQNIILSDLISFVRKGIPDINELLLEKDWAYIRTESFSEDKVSTWAYKMERDSTADAWLKIESNPKYLNVVELQFFNSPTYTKLLNSIKALGAKKIDSKVDDDGKIITRFAGKTYIYELSTLANRHEIVVFDRKNFLKSILEGLEEAGATIDTLVERN